MCGIIGMAGALEYRDKDVIRDLLHFCELRGEDSTGYFTVTKDSNDAPITKVVGPTRNLFDTSAFDKLSLYNKRAFIGHCRKATIGGISKRTAHPFNYGAFTGVHNGTLRNWKLLPGVSEDTDSMTLYDNFASVGVRETIEAVDGAYALIWWNEETQELNILRNKERPLYYAFSEKGDKVIFASEEWMIHVATSRNSFKLMDLTPKAETFKSVQAVPEDQWWRVKLGRTGQQALTFLTAADGHDEDLKGGTKKATYAQSSAPFQYRTPFAWEGDLDDDPNVDVTRDLPRLPAPQQQGQTSTAAASATTSSSTTSSSSTATTRPSTATQTPRPTLSLVQTSKSAGSGSSNAGGLLVGYKGLLLNHAEFNELVDDCCIWCKQPYTYAELRDGGRLGEWVDEDEFICVDCFKCAGEVSAC